MDYPNKGIIRTEEGPVKVACALPGQTVRCSIKKFRSGSGEGILREVVKKAADETEVPCPHYGKCGGCLYQTFTYAKELEIKEGQVRRLIEPVLEAQSSSYEFEPILASPVYGGYRNKMEYSFGDEYKDGPLALGMHRRGSMYDIETVVSCNIADADNSLIIRETVDFFAGLNIRYYHKITHIGYLRHLLVRRTRTGEILIGLVTSSQTEMMPVGHSEEDILSGYTGVLRKLEDEGKLNGSIHGIIHIVNDSVADAVKADKVDVLYGEDFITEELLGLKFKITPFSFFQTNTYGAEVLYSKVREYAVSSCSTDGGTIYDLYSGTGTIAQIMAGGFKGEVIGVEIVEEAVSAACDNARLNGLDNCKFIAGDVLNVLDELSEKPDLIIIDPPRDGIHPKALPKIIGYGVDTIIYVSCKTTSLARDLPVFLEAGYEVKKICPVDQFPRTGNIEVCCLLEQLKSAKEHIEITIDA